MSEQYTTGVVVTGKVTGIQDYGAFVALGCRNTRTCAYI